MTTNAKHIFEIEPRAGRKCFRMIVAAETASSSKGWIQNAADKAERFARDLMADDEDGRLTSCGIYHSYPSPGPRRRFVGEVKA